MLQLTITKIFNFQGIVFRISRNLVAFDEILSFSF